MAHEFAFAWTSGASSRVMKASTKGGAPPRRIRHVHIAAAGLDWFGDWILCARSRASSRNVVVFPAPLAPALNPRHESPIRSLSSGK
jgi:hypothetical protein